MTHRATSRPTPRRAVEISHRTATQVPSIRSRKSSSARPTDATASGPRTTPPQLPTSARRRTRLGTLRSHGARSCERTRRLTSRRPCVAACTARRSAPVLRCSAALLQCCSAAVLQCCSAAPSHESQSTPHTRDAGSAPGEAVRRPDGVPNDHHAARRRAALDAPLLAALP
jgi:hypothetical protein